ncbi:MAG TPA: YjiG family protein [Candidatus Aphodousia faecigallinarum]|uniref:YjiG family protein n=1 Tax=Candidatus Aphodousia faecigallinarum TaxID=2840677 RepID=A0A9D1IJ70_9BURK|nr:YjiG family protein [Candidatus Aphodousia faecigallinarum]
MSSENSKPMVTDVFVKGAVQGWGIATHSTIPNVLMAFVIIRALNVAGLLPILGDIFRPIMVLFGLPGEAAAVLIAGWMSMGGGVGVAAALFDQGALTVEHCAILAPGIYLMGSQLQYMGRCLGVIGTRGKVIPLLMGVAVLNALIGMFIMNIIV